MQHTSVFVPALILLPLSRQTRGTFLYIIPEEKREKNEDVGGRECVEKKEDKTERYGGGGGRQQKQQEREEER